MKNKKLFIISMFTFLIPIGIYLIFYNQLPDQIPIHWNAAGEIDNYASKPIALFAMPCILLLAHIFVLWAMDKDPKHRNIPKIMYNVMYFVMPILSIFICITTLSSTLETGLEINITMASTLLIGVIITIVGNFLPKCKQSYTVGIKTPWALDDEENWNKTHRFGGFLWMICGLFIIFGAFISTTISSAYFITIILIMTIIPYGYSYLLYKKKKGN